MRYFILIIFFALTLFAESYNHSLLKIHSKVFPRLLLTDKNFDNKVFDKSVTIYILYTPQDFRVAENFKTSLHHRYKQLQGHKLNIILQTYADFVVDDKALAYYFLHADEQTIRKANLLLDNYNIISFSYESSYLDFGTVMSLKVGKKLSPYLNLKAIKKRKIILKNILYKIAEIQ